MDIIGKKKKKIQFVFERTYIIQLQISPNGEKEKKRTVRIFGAPVICPTCSHTLSYPSLTIRLCSKFSFGVRHKKNEAQGG